MEKDVNRLRLAKEALESGSYDRETIEYIFPELKESEDERIKKVLIGWFKRYKEEDICGSETFNGIPTDNILAWLEKQGEHANFRNKIQIGDKVTRNEDGMLVNMSQFKRIAKRDEKQDEQKPADKVEPKFKVGNWYQCVKDFFGKGVTFDKNTAYYCAKEGCLQDEYGCHIAIVKDLYDNFKLWSIQDAKDGNILSDGTTIFIFKDLLSDGSVMSYCDYDADSGECDAFCPLSMNLMCSKITPATKEQRDALIKAIADAGYAFDFEKKELKKFEQKATKWDEKTKGLDELETYILSLVPNRPLDAIKVDSKNIRFIINKEQKSWSEEDEQFLLVCKNALAKYQVSDKWDASIISQWLENRLKPLRFQSPTNTGETH